MDCLKNFIAGKYAKYFCVLLSWMFYSQLFANSQIAGYWLVPDDENGGKIQSAVLMYENGGKYYCRMLVIYDEDSGKIIDTISKPSERAKAIAGNPYLCGKDFIWGLTYNKANKRFAGKVVDPDTGKIYKCEVWYNEDKNCLVVRGEIFIFGKNAYWPEATENMLPKSERLDPQKLEPDLLLKNAQ